MKRIFRAESTLFKYGCLNERLGLSGASRNFVPAASHKFAWPVRCLISCGNSCKLIPNVQKLSSFFRHSEPAQLTYFLELHELIFPLISIADDHNCFVLAH